jgi:hypothetical protein
VNADRGWWAGAVALVLALAVGVSLCGAILIIALDDRADDSQLGTVITTLAGAAVGAVATYLGTKATTNGGAQSAAEGPGEPGPGDDTGGEVSSSEPQPPAGAGA